MKLEKINIGVDGKRVVGKIKPMHCINNIPSFRGDKVGLIKNANIPYCRFHDTSLYPPFRLVDIPYIFPDFSADETKEENYDFKFTDVLFDAVMKNGIKPFVRLGVSIENYAYIKPYNIYPPTDFHKWARICEHFVRHYNEGWANGYFYDIEYWEIWNEPDNAADDPKNIIDNAMWRGSKEDFFRLYEITSNHLKKCFPNLKIGGYGNSGFYAIYKDSDDVIAAANVSPRTEYFVAFFHEFLRYISSQEHSAPLDFYSFHSYSGVKHNEAYAAYVRKILDEYGFKNTETNLNEWNPSYKLRGTLQDSANVSANLIALQNSSLDMAMYYDWTQNFVYCGAFNPLDGTPFPTYYAFWMFGRLYELSAQVSAQSDNTDVYVLAAQNDNFKDVIITNGSDKTYGLCLHGVRNINEVRILAEGIDFNESVRSCPDVIGPWQSIYIRMKAD